MLTPYQQNVVREIHAEAKARKAAYRAKYGEDFCDVLIVSYNQHGKGKTGFTCEFNAAKTWQSGWEMKDFAKHVFGGGRLRLIDKNEVGEFWVVFSK